MKNFLIFLVVVVIVIAGYMLIKKSSNPFDGKNSEDTSLEGKQLESPSANESGSYTVNKKVSSLNLVPSNGDAVKFEVGSGELLVESGSISGGTTTASSSRLNKLPGFQNVAGGDISLEVKALVFERARSTSENLVYRTDTELTVNGVTHPVSFDSTFRYQSGEYYIIGQTVPDWKNWGISLPAGESVSMNFVLLATK